MLGVDVVPLPHEGSGKPKPMRHHKQDLEEGAEEMPAKESQHLGTFWKPGEETTYQGKEGDQEIRLVLYHQVPASRVPCHL